MAAGTSPIWPAAVNRGFGKISAANVNLDGTGTIVLLYTAGANGDMVEKLLVRHLGINVASVLRIFANDGLGLLAANFSLIQEVTIAANPALSQVAASALTDILLNPGSGYGLRGGEKLYGSTGTVLAAGWMVSTVGGGSF